ncbi:3-hydroxyisobutyrate dehydrogenase [Paucimonas lemoignei]|uniref:3-hydroxyisobutyrate dehydrogenase n=1 Tax=Paucimonas lemoignei TaxID=29443 RepID=A0A4R3I1M4_PAULE|nr:3-hydroxyisobutyrate dehydrogenase [Paucimonas lemoignei]TCS39104.1 3-hydroxyisobutyrate dehydrogenase [Paucimonas lemoignei]
MNIAFIGLGNMGLPMAKNLVKAGFTVTGFDLSAAALQALEAAGGKTADSAAQAADGAQVVVSMLPAAAHVKSLYLGSGQEGEGLLARLPAGTLVIDSSTISTSAAREVAQAAREKGVAMIDAPVSGGTTAAAAGTLTFMVGGAEQDLDQARPVLEKMGKNIFHAGGHGAGQTAKVCNNMLLGIIMSGTCEALQLGIAHGLDPKVLSEIMGKSSGASWVVNSYNPCPGTLETSPSARGYIGGFATDLMLKDLGLAMEAATDIRASVPLGGLARNLFALHSAAGNGKLDFGSIFRMFESAES